MRAKPEYRDRADTEVAVLDALADRKQEGMTVFELRSRTEITIDEIETALEGLKDDDLITVDKTDERTVILPADDVVGPTEEPGEPSLLDQLRRRFRL
jgi:transcription initiation factor IIE alpha subunit